MSHDSKFGSYSPRTKHIHFRRKICKILSDSEQVDRIVKYSQTAKSALFPALLTMMEVAYNEKEAEKVTLEEEKAVLLERVDDLEKQNGRLKRRLVGAGKGTASPSRRSSTPIVSPGRQKGRAGSSPGMKSPGRRSVDVASPRASPGQRKMMRTSSTSDREPGLSTTSGWKMTVSPKGKAVKARLKFVIFCFPLISFIRGLLLPL
jgi:hypothetical protein